ncbi:MAG: PstS family phosphate ABC transporter substrate-binding protein [Bacteroidia bacterium]|nr:PstS family phosphate ABC transporter substrate-binding protein [Bacteroidia bacterium]
MVFRLIKIFFSFVLIVAFSCQRAKQKNLISSDEKIKISGSNSEYELVSRLIQEYVKTKNPNFSYEIEGEGSEIGIRKFLKGEIDMAMSSRRMKPFEFNILEANGTDYLEIVFAYDALAFITNYKNSVDSLSLEQISDILSGKIINWIQVSKFKGPVRVYGRNTESGTFHFVENKFQILGLRKYQISCNTSREILENVMNDSCGFGYVSIGYILDNNKKLNKNIWPVPVYYQSNRPQAVSPLQHQYVSKNLYPVCRPLYQYFKLPLKKELKEFLMFELSSQGQKIVEDAGFYKINTELQTQNNIQLMKLMNSGKVNENGSEVGTGN